MEDVISDRPPPRDPMDGEDHHPSLSWLREQWELGNTKKLEDMVALWRTFELLGRIGRGARRLIIIMGKILVWFSGLVGAYWVIVEGFGKIRGGQP